MRVTLDWTQSELASRARVTQGWISKVETGDAARLTFHSAELILGAMGARLRISIDAPYLGDRQRQREPAHARCSGFVESRLRRGGWDVASEIEVGGDRSRGWIDVIACHPSTGWLLVIEIKTEIHDLGAIERSLHWYEREAPAAARRLGWRPRRSMGCLLLLATESNETRASTNRIPLAEGFRLRARELRTVVGGAADAPSGRAMAMIDPLSRRDAWIRPLRIDGRRTAAPYADYAGFMGAILRRGRGRGRSSIREPAASHAAPKRPGPTRYSSRS